MKTIDSNKIISLICAQATSADMWIRQWEQYKDVGGVRNAALAIGKMHGLFNVLVTMNGPDEDVPEAIIQMMQRYSDIWDGLHISKTMAAALAVHSD